MKIIILALLCCSCGVIKGPNYNQGLSHNEQLGNNARIVRKEDKRVKKTMIKTRSRVSSGKVRKTRKGRGRKYIN